MNELQDKIESEVITRTFNVSGMPETVFKEVDLFCKEHFGDNRWTMIWTLVKGQQEDLKFAMLFDKVQELEVKYNELNEKFNQPKQEEKVLKTFGKRD
jgi:hypothetical protein